MRTHEHTVRTTGLGSTLVDKGLNLRDRLYDMENHLMGFKFDRVKESLDNFNEDYDAFLGLVDELEQKLERLEEAYEKLSARKKR